MQRVSIQADFCLPLVILIITISAHTFHRHLLYKGSKALLSSALSLSLERDHWVRNCGMRPLSFLIIYWGMFFQKHKCKQSDQPRLCPTEIKLLPSDKQSYCFECDFTLFCAATQIRDVILETRTIMKIMYFHHFHDGVFNVSMLSCLKPERFTRESLMSHLALVASGCVQVCPFSSTCFLWQSVRS